MLEATSETGRLLDSHSPTRAWAVMAMPTELTKEMSCRLVMPVLCLRHVIAVVLLTLWLPATQHCGLEAAGLIAADAPHGAHEGCAKANCDHCTHDGCNVVEGGFVKSSHEALKAPTPPLVACTRFLCLQLLPPVLAIEPNLAVSESAFPDDWVPVWQFVRRAAPLSRAPSLIG
ncbi:hypothetical protein [Oleiharenicola sp. Vm1]|uniref:hypothetical protein n=1 Tax=Oleiharenicola sp. Vm1 TaxID=3398393 RepID=UPI0039F5FBAE